MSALSDTKKPEPGDKDPSIPERIYKYLSLISQSAQGALKLRYLTLALGFSQRADSMHRGGEEPWWKIVAADKMTYECDSKLGSPKAIDCTQVRSQLGATSDSVQVGAGEVRFLSSSKIIISPPLLPSPKTDFHARYLPRCPFSRQGNRPYLGPNPSSFGHTDKALHLQSPTPPARRKGFL